MNSIAEINRINQRELELGITAGSWHDEYKDSAYIFIGGLDFGLTEGDVITVFSQFGEIADVNLPRDKTTGKTRGFGFVMYENQKSTVLAVDNMNGAEVVGRIVRVDHCRSYQQPKEKNAEGEWVLPDEPSYNALPQAVEVSESESSEEESEPDNIDDEDPMAAYLREQKRAIKGKGKAKKDGESKEERRKRRAEKKAKKEAKRAAKAAKKDKGVKKDISDGRKDRERSEKRDRSDRDRDRDRDVSRRDRDREASPDRRRHRDREDRERERPRDDYRNEKERVEYSRERDDRDRR